MPDLLHDATALGCQAEAAPGPGSRRASWRTLLGAHDLIMLAYLVVVRLLVWGAAAGPVRDSVSLKIDLCIGAMLAGCLVARVLPRIPFAVRWFVYRLVLTAVILETYLMLRDLLPLVRQDSVDGALLAIDRWIFGVEPSLWLERLNRRPIVEWFAFFYFGYFWVHGCYLLVVGWLSPGGRQTSEYAIGIFLVFCVGQLTYLAVPGYGPITHLAHEFQGPVDGGFFWSCVWDTVQGGGALKDIFPSLHTAGPTFMTLFAWHRAKLDRRWRWGAIATAFFTANIVFSTVFLRWHYVIDVVAGLALAVAARLVAPPLAEREEQWRRRRGERLVWQFR
ncbi:MAG: phosphatase PAP2 family protein [Deltaproteobacteria bacterium]|nr:phosphatase PAP2 family protein [Deltaproteobacteria bacterium]